MHSSDPFDNGDPWATVPSNPPQRPSLIAPTEHEASASSPTSSSTATITTTTTSTSSAHTAPTQNITHTQNVTHTQLIEQTTPSTAFEDQPPSYENIVKDLPQIHDNYDHLRGPPGQRGVDVKTRIPLDSTPASHYQSGANGSGSGSSSAPRVASPDTRYGAIPQSPPSSSRLVQPSAPSAPHSGLQGQAALGREDDSHHFRAVDRLLGPDGQANDTRARSDTSSEHGDGEEEPSSHWSIVGESRVWIGLFYTVVVLLPWAVFCFVWTIVTLIIASVAMVVPPVGYFFAMATITSWRALARVDLAMATHLVTRQVRSKHPHKIEKVFVSVPDSVSSSPAHSSSPSSDSTNGTTTHRRSRIRRSNLWSKGSLHLNAAIKNKHTLKAMSYFMIWKMVFALPIFIVTVAFAGLTIPFMVCLLPSLLIVNRAFMGWQFRWAIVWLAEKQQPIILD
ncbi:hypothetical protein BGZ74_007429 [Mortierella antarctica]|nr:hypothetical protein BGZ74_007429 [Mortierella antarctica]